MLSIFALHDDYRMNDPRQGGPENPMRKLIFAINTTLDGGCDHAKQHADEETLEYFTHLTREVDLQVWA